jgi:hypothetical protein
MTDRTAVVAGVEALAAEIGGTAVTSDVTSRTSVQGLAEAVGGRGASLVRYGGDRERAEAVYAGVPDPHGWKPRMQVRGLTAEDVAEAIIWMATRPSHVDIDELVIRPRAQAAQHKVHRIPD